MQAIIDYCKRTREIKSRPYLAWFVLAKTDLDAWKTAVQSFPHVLSEDISDWFVDPNWRTLVRVLHLRHVRTKCTVAWLFRECVQETHTSLSEIISEIHSSMTKIAQAVYRQGRAPFVCIALPKEILSRIYRICKIEGWETRKFSISQLAADPALDLDPDPDPDADPDPLIDLSRICDPFEEACTRADFDRLGHGSIVKKCSTSYKIQPHPSIYHTQSLHQSRYAEVCGALKRRMPSASASPRHLLELASVSKSTPKVDVLRSFSIGSRQIYDQLARLPTSKFNYFGEGLTREEASLIEWMGECACSTFSQL